jgi:hypothetical protein
MATLTLHHRPGTVTIRDEGTVRAVAAAVARWTRGHGDTGFRIRRPSPSRHLRRTDVFKASQVATLNANGVDLTDLPAPVATSPLAVAA